MTGLCASCALVGCLFATWVASVQLRLIGMTCRHTCCQLDDDFARDRDRALDPESAGDQGDGAADRAARQAQGALRMDNGPELTSMAFTEWCTNRGIDTRFIQPGNPCSERVQRTLQQDLSGRSARCLRVRIRGASARGSRRPGCTNSRRSGHLTASVVCRPRCSCRGQVPGSLALSRVLDGEAYAMSRRIVRTLSIGVSQMLTNVS